jgi:Bardet-Biedl syndrome 2 protein
MWLNQNFLLAEEMEFKTDISISFLSLRNHQDLHLVVEANGTTTVRTHDIDLAGDILQSLFQFLHVEDLEVKIISQYIFKFGIK